MADEESRHKTVMAGPKKKPAKKAGKKPAGKGGAKKRPVHKMHISHTDNGKYHVEHEFKPELGGPPMPNEHHGIEDMDELHDHLDQHMSPQPEAAPVPPPGIGAGGPPMGGGAGEPQPGGGAGGGMV